MSRDDVIGAAWKALVNERPAHGSHWPFLVWFIDDEPAIVVKCGCGERFKIVEEALS